MNNIGISLNTCNNIQIIKNNLSIGKDDILLDGRFQYFGIESDNQWNLNSRIEFEQLDKNFDNILSDKETQEISFIEIFLTAQKKNRQFEVKTSVAIRNRSRPIIFNDL